jgi:hypothetical protein
MAVRLKGVRVLDVMSDVLQLVAAPVRPAADREAAMY